MLKFDDFINFMSKAEALLESPQLVDKDYDEPVEELSDPSIFSNEILTTQYQHIGDAKIAGEKIHLYIQESSGKYLVIGVVPSDKYVKYNTAVFSLKLIELNYIDDKVKSLGNKCLAVSLVYNKDEYRYKGLSSQVYVMLAKHGYVIISDELHYKGAKNLWKRLAYLKGLIKVRVFDNDSDQFIKDSTGGELYDGSNIPDDVIWSTDDSKMSILLVLSID